jgi:hypothetical protein
MDWVGWCGRFRCPVPDHLPNSTVSPTFRSIGISLPLSSRPPRPTAMTSPCEGFSLAVSGIMMPPAVFSSASMRLMPAALQGISPLRTGLHVEFPANREINREFCKIRLLSAILPADTRANSEACGQIPYSTEQGIFAKELGIWTAPQGVKQGLGCWIDSLAGASTSGACE